MATPYRLRPGEKWIGGVPHVRLRCRRCQGLVWTQAIHGAGRRTCKPNPARFVCRTCQGEFK